MRDLKWLKFVLLFLIINPVSGRLSAQVLDTISQKQFNHYSFRDYKRIYKGEPKALQIINRFHRNRIIAYSLYGVSGVLLPTIDFIGPASVYTLATGCLINIKNSKRQLYSQLKTYEKYHHIQPIEPLRDSIFSEVILSQKTFDSSFTIPFSEFKELSNEKIQSKYNVNDTTNLIFQLFEKTEKRKDVYISLSIVFPILGTLTYFEFGPPLRNETMMIAFIFESIYAIGTAVSIPNAIDNYQYAKREYLYQSLQSHFNHQTFDCRTQHYISHHIKNIKY